MGKIEVRFSVIVALAMSGLSFLMMLLTDYRFYVINKAAYIGEDCGGLILGQVLFAGLSLAFYFADLCLMFAYKKLHKGNLGLSVILLILILAGVPIILNISDYELIPVLAWKIDYFALIALESIWFIRYLRSEPR